MSKVINNMLILKICIGLCFFSSYSFAEWYVGVDQTEMDFHINFANSKQNYDLNLTRLKVGYAKDNYSLEFHYYDDDLDESPASTTQGVVFDVRTGIKNIYGIYARAASTGRLGVYGLMGMVFVNTEFDIVGFNIVDYADFDSFSVGAGVHYKFTDNFIVNLDYVEMEGDVNYPTYTVQTGGAVDAQLKGWGLGARYLF